MGENVAAFVPAASPDVARLTLEKTACDAAILRVAPLLEDPNPALLSWTQLNTGLEGQGGAAFRVVTRLLCLGDRLEPTMTGTTRCEQRHAGQADESP